MSAPPLGRAWPAKRAFGPLASRRVGLRVKALAITVLPVLLMGALIALILTAQRTAALGVVARSLATSVARVLATTLDVQDLQLVNTQLQAAVSSQSVAFVNVQPEGQVLRFFVSKAPETDWYLRAQYDRFLREHPGEDRFLWRDDRAQRYREALAQLPPNANARGARAHLGDTAARLDATEGQLQRFQIVHLEVYGLPSGQRNLRFPGQARPAGTRLFQLDIGVVNDDITALMDRQLHLVLLACVLVVAGAALLAWLAAGQLVRPILAVTAATDRISLGDIDTPVRVDTSDELRDLGQAVERLRVSLQLALRRLRPHS